MPDLSDDQEHMIRHALGLDKKKHPTRNRFACSETGNRIAIAKTLIALGYAVAVPDLDYGSMRVFKITTAGAEAYGTKLKPALRPPEPAKLAA